MSNENSAVTLTAKQEKFAVGVAAGLTQSDAYRMAYNASGMQPKQVWEEDSKLRRKPKVAQRIEALLRAARVQDITNIGREIRRTMDLQQEALAAGNHNASAAYQRMLMTTVGALQQRLVLTVESSLSDKELIEQLSGGDPERLAAARVLLGAGDGFPEGPPPEDHESETRH
jgi:hypothetical protein